MTRVVLIVCAQLSSLCLYKYFILANERLSTQIWSSLSALPIAPHLQRHATDMFFVKRGQ